MDQNKTTSQNTNPSQNTNSSQNTNPSTKQSKKPFLLVLKVIGIVLLVLIVIGILALVTLHRFGTNESDDANNRVTKEDNISEDYDEDNQDEKNNDSDDYTDSEDTSEDSSINHNNETFSDNENAEDGTQDSSSDESVNEELERQNIEAMRTKIEASHGSGYEVGQILPECPIYDEDGTKHYVSECLGTPLYINIFTTWCGPCNMEMPDIQDACENHEGEIDFILISVNEGWSDIHAFENNYDLTMPVYRIGDNFGTYPIYSIPQHFVLDKYGRIVAYNLGGTTSQWMESAISTALEE